MNDWAMVGIGDSTPEIETGVLTGGTAAALSSTYKYSSWTSITTEAYHVPLNGLNINGTFGKFEWNEHTTYLEPTGSAGTSGLYYFYRSTATNARCSSSTTMLVQTPILGAVSH